MNYIGNAFSPNMVGEAVVEITPCHSTDVPDDAASVVGHESTAAVLSELLRRPVPVNRVAVSLDPGDRLYLVALTSGGKPYRPPEGAVLDEVALSALRLEWRRIQIFPADALCGQFSASEAWPWKFRPCWSR